MNFFDKQRRRITLTKWLPKHNNEDEKRVLLEFSLLLTGQPITGYPEFISDGFTAIEKQGAPIASVELETQLEGVSLEFYDTEKSRGRLRVIAAATLQKFVLERKHEITSLTFKTTVPRPIDIYEFLDRYEAKDLYAVFDVTQAKLVFSGDDDANEQNKLFEGGGAEEDSEDDDFGDNQRRIAEEMPTRGKAAKAKAN